MGLAVRFEVEALDPGPGAVLEHRGCGTEDVDLNVLIVIEERRRIESQVAIEQLGFEAEFVGIDRLGIHRLRRRPPRGYRVIDSALEASVIGHIPEQCLRELMIQRHAPGGRPEQGMRIGEDVGAQMRQRRTEDRALIALTALRSMEYRAPSVRWVSAPPPAGWVCAYAALASCSRNPAS